MKDPAAKSPALSSRRRFLKNTALAGGGVALGSFGIDAVSPSIWHDPLPLEPNPSFWARSQRPLNSPAAADMNVDVAIVGGGLTGLSAAYYLRLASPEKSVALFEAKGCGNGASGRNGAMVLTMTADRYMNFSADPAMDKEIYDLTVANIRSLAALSSATGIDCELQTAGALQVFNRPQDAAAARAYVQRARALKFPVELWDAKQVAEALGTPAYAGGFFDPNGGQVHPMKLVQVFKAAAQGAGAAVYENTRVDAIEEGAVHVLRIGGHIVKARSLVLATNAFTPNLGFLRNSVMPLREYVAMTGPLSERDFEELGWRSRMPFNDSRTEVFYLGVTRDRRIHIGGGAPHYDFNNGAGAAAAAPTHVLALKRELARIFPRLAGIDFDLSWNGVVDWSLDAAPSVGSIGKHRNIFYGLGYSGHGVNLTSIFGRIIADLAAGREAQWRHFPFVNARFGYVPNEPFRLAAARASLAWYGLTE